MAVFPFDNVFQHKLLGLFKEGNIDSSSIDQTAFQNPILTEIYLAITTLQKQDITPITKRILFSQAIKARIFRDKEYQEDLKESIDLLFKPCKSSEKLFILKSVSDFNRLQSYKQTLLQAEDLLQDPDNLTLEKLDGLFSKQVRDDSQNLDKGEFYFSSLINRLKERNRDPEIIKSLIPDLDRCLDNGGFAPEEINLACGLPSAGKTFWLLHMAKAAVAQKKKVLFISLEMTTSKLASRLDAAYIGVETHKLREHDVQLQRTLRKLRREFGDNLLLKKMPAGQTNTTDIHNYIHALRLTDFKPEVLILDYMNILAPKNPSREGRHRDLGQSYIDLKGITQEYHMWLFTAAQSNREGHNAKLITMVNLSDSFEGSMHSDIVISLNRDDDDAKRERLRIYLAKDKNGIDKRVINISTNYAKGAFWRPNVSIYGSTSTENGESQGQSSQKKPRKAVQKKLKAKKR